MEGQRVGVKLWAFAHLLSNGRLADVILFGAFLGWAIVDFISARKRDRAAGTVYPAGHALRTALTVAAGVAAWAAFVFGLHLWLIGVIALLFKPSSQKITPFYSTINVGFAICTKLPNMHWEVVLHRKFFQIFKLTYDFIPL